MPADCKGDLVFCRAGRTGHNPEIFRTSPQKTEMPRDQKFSRFRGAVMSLVQNLRFRVTFDPTDIGGRLFDLMRYRLGMTPRLGRQVFAIAVTILATPSLAGPPQDSALSGRNSDLGQHAVPAGPEASAVMVSEKAKLEPDVDLYALMSGRCRILKIAGRDFACRTVAYFHNEQGRVHFTVVLDDPADKSHVVSFSGENGWRTLDNQYELPIDRMLLKSKDRPKVDGLPVPHVEYSAGLCKQVGNFAARQVSSVSCSAIDGNGRQYEMQFESDGSPITLRRIRQTPPSIRQDPFR